MQGIYTMAHYNDVRGSVHQTAYFDRDDDWSPRETFLFIVFASAAGWAAALYPLFVR